MDRKRLMIVFKYDGSKFNGFQRQKTARSVQKEIEDALLQIYDKEILIKGAGRTDAGVHANYQVAHFDVESYDKSLIDRMNDILSPDIFILKLKEVKENFHARKDAKMKEYVYKINVGQFKVFYNDYIYQPTEKLDIGLMKKASKEFLGAHDFHNFVSGYREDYNSFIKSIKFTKFGDILEIHFIGVGFYRYMVRNMMGALLEIGKCHIYPSTIKDMLDNPDSGKSLPTASPVGLYLNKIWY